jgi:hypothetical protein
LGLDFTTIMIMTLQGVIDDRISFLKEQINSNNKPAVNSTFQLQINVIRSIDDDIEEVAVPLCKEDTIKEL